MAKRKKIIITIDAEGDNIWSHSLGEKITTENAKYLDRFQRICERYGFRPVWLANWEMISDDYFVGFINANKDSCEIGMHLHAWNNPPFYEIPLVKNQGLPYLIEYPEDIIDQKIKMITDEIIKKTGVHPVSHRAGRWAINDIYLRKLKKNGYFIDCSVTPGIDWRSSLGGTSNAMGMDYRKELRQISKREGIFEIPVTTYRNHELFWEREESLKRNIHEIYNGIKGRESYLRPNGRNLKELMWVIDENLRRDSDDYLMFMLHSSELMPGGSPLFQDAFSIERLYKHINTVFSYLYNFYECVTLKEYVEQI